MCGSEWHDSGRQDKTRLFSVSVYVWNWETLFRKTRQDYSVSVSLCVELNNIIQEDKSRQDKTRQDNTIQCKCHFVLKWVSLLRRTREEHSGTGSVSLCVDFVTLLRKTRDRRVFRVSVSFCGPSDVTQKDTRQDKSIQGQCHFVWTLWHYSERHKTRQDRSMHGQCHFVWTLWHCLERHKTGVFRVSITLCGLCDITQKDTRQDKRKVFAVNVTLCGLNDITQKDTRQQNIIQGQCHCLWMTVVALSSLARIFGKCSTIHFPCAIFLKVKISSRPLIPFC